MTEPVVSVVMAAYNGAGLIGDTIASLLAQTLPAWELIVVDDCSTDTTREVIAAVRDPRITLIRAAENGGPVRARNRALEAARGRYVAGLDQDDLCRADRFAVQSAWLDAHSDVALCGTAAARLSGRTMLPPCEPHETSPALIEWLMRLRNPLVWSSTMMRRDAAVALTPFTRPDRLYAEDFDLYHRLRPHGRIARIDEPLTVYRLHAGGASKRYRERMIASASLVLAEANRAVLGATADDDARLIATHLAALEPVRDRAALLRLDRLVATLHAAFVAETDPSPADRALIERETSHLWWRLVRTSVRSGALPLTDAIAARPASARRAESRPADLILSGLIGSGRKLNAALLGITL